MFSTERRQISFHDSIYDHVIPKDHFLRKLSNAVDWESFVPILKPLYSDEGRPAHAALMMLKLIVLQFMYDLSDRNLSEAARYRLDFKWFVGLAPDDVPPDYTGYCRFRDRMGSETIAEVFNRVVEEARAKGLVADSLSIVDATEVKAKVDTYRMHQKKKDGGGGPPDPDAAHGYKSKDKPFFGYKSQAAMDDEGEIVTRVDTVPGNVSETERFEEIVDPLAYGTSADKGYDSETNFRIIKEHGRKAAIIPRKKKGRMRGHVKARYPIEAERQYYYRNKRRRSIIEKKFAEAKIYHGLARARYWGLEKVTRQTLLTFIAINLKRMVTLLFGVPRWRYA